MKSPSKSPIMKKITHALRSPILLGCIITIAFVYAAKEYYRIRALNDVDRKSNALFDLIEIADLKSMDMRFRFRGEQVTNTPVALLTIDDDSVQEIGRWPWSREKIAYLIEEIFKYGGKSIAMDIIFAEPQEDYKKQAIEKLDSEIKIKSPEITSFLNAALNEKSPDTILSDTITKYHDKIVLGSFAEDHQISGDENIHPYQDYCRNEAFRKINSEKFVKLNSTFIVNDEAESFEELQFSQFFPEILGVIEANYKKLYLSKLFNKTDELSLNQQEKNRLNRFLNQELMNYCNRWLTDQDEFWGQKSYETALLEIFSKSPLLKDLSFNEAVTKLKTTVKSHPLTAKDNWTINTDNIQANADFTGSFNTYQDQDGTIRKSALFFRTGNKIGTSFIPSIALQSFLIATGLQARIELNKDPKRNNQKIISKFQIFDTSKEPEVLYADVPVDRQGRFQINYSGGRAMIPYLPAKELFTASDDITIEQSQWVPSQKRWMTGATKVKKADFIKDKVFIFGATAVGIYDLRVSPFEKNLPGPETHANVVANLFDKKFIKPSINEDVWMLVALVLIGFIFTLIIEYSGAIFGFISTLLLVFIIVAVDAYLFSHGIYFATVLPFFLIISLYPIMTFYKYFTEEKNKKKIRATFSKYVSPAIVDEILKSSENIELGGKKAPVTVMFSDVRGFTTISEKLDPHALTNLLNRYLTPMTEIVFNNKGTLDKYMGDAIMAFFGAPIAYREHAACACRCALESINKLKELKEIFKSEGLPEIDIGIGINTGEVNVGNMGSEIVRSYTVMGDAVNLGSRLESINKEYGTRIIISEFVQAEIKNQFFTREVDWVKVKGKTKPVRIFELIAEGKITDEQKNKFYESFKTGFELYHQMRFNEALTYFEMAHKIDSDDELSQLYIERTNEYVATPPPPDWDGVYTMKTK